MNCISEEFIRTSFPYLNIVEIIFPNNEKFNNLHQKIWKMQVSFYHFPFSKNGYIDNFLYNEAKIQTRHLFIKKSLDMTSRYVYLSIYLNKVNNFLLLVEINNFKLNIDKILSSEFEFYKVFSDEEIVMMQKGEYEWELVYKLNY